MAAPEPPLLRSRGLTEAMRPRETCSCAQQSLQRPPLHQNHQTGNSLLCQQLYTPSRSRHQQSVQGWVRNQRRITSRTGLEVDEVVVDVAEASLAGFPDHLPSWRQPQLRQQQAAAEKVSQSQTTTKGISSSSDCLRAAARISSHLLAAGAAVAAAGASCPARVAAARTHPAAAGLGLLHVLAVAVEEAHLAARRQNKQFQKRYSAPGDHDTMQQSLGFIGGRGEFRGNERVGGKGQPYQKDTGRRRPPPQFWLVQVTCSQRVFWRHQWQVTPRAESYTLPPWSKAFIRQQLPFSNWSTESEVRNEQGKNVPTDGIGCGLR